MRFIAILLFIFFSCPIKSQISVEEIVNDFENEFSEPLDSTLIEYYNTLPLRFVPRVGFNHQSIGFLISGKVLRGSVSVGEQVEVVGNGYERKQYFVSTIIINQNNVDIASVGDNCVLQLRGSQQKDFKQMIGLTICPVGDCKVTDLIKAKISLKQKHIPTSETIWGIKKDLELVIDDKTLNDENIDLENALNKESLIFTENNAQLYGPNSANSVKLFYQNKLLHLTGNEEKEVYMALTKPIVIIEEAAYQLRANGKIINIELSPIMW